MNRRPTLLLRAIRTMVGLLTIWCLGCSGYEPIVASLSSESELSTSACDSPRRKTPETNNPTASAIVVFNVAPSASISSDDAEMNCCAGGCCHAVSIVHLPVVQMRVGALQQMSELPGELASISRAPLIPPPQRDT